MTHDELTRAFKEATSAPPPFAKERVWKGLQSPRPQRARLVLALGVAVLLGAGVTRAVLRGQEADGQWHDGAASAVWSRAHIERSGHTLTLERGAVAVSSWGTPVEVHARSHVVVVERGVAIVQVAGESVTVELVEGALSFDGETRVAPTTTATLLSDAATRLDAPATRPLRLTARAETAERERRYDDAAKLWAEVAASGSLDAEVANFRQGELELRRLQQPARALATFDAGQARHPSGALTQERHLSAIESCVALARWDEVERRTAAFLEAHPQSERADEVRGLHARALLQRGASREACGELSTLRDAPTALLDACR